MINHIICVPMTSGEQEPLRHEKDGFIHPRSMFCPFALMQLPRQSSGCCHFGADALVSLLGLCNPKLAKRLTHRMVPGEARRFALELAKVYREYLDRDDWGIPGMELLMQGMLWFFVVSALGFGVGVGANE